MGYASEVCSGPQKLDQAISYTFGLPCVPGTDRQFGRSLAWVGSGSSEARSSKPR